MSDLKIKSFLSADRYLFIQNNGTDEMEILPGMHGNSLFLYQLSLNAWKSHDLRFNSGPCSKIPRQQSKLQLPFFLMDVWETQ